MSVTELLQQLERQGVELWLEGERLRFRAPKGALDGELRTQIGERRAEVIAELRRLAQARVATFPLSFSQRSLWFLNQQAPQSAAYHVALPMRVLVAINRAALEQAVQALLDRHASLRTTYDFSEDSPCQRIVGSVTACIDLHSRVGTSDADLRAEVEADYRRPFDLSTGPLLRVSLYSRSEADHVLLLTVHHIAADGWSLLLLFQELLALYGEFNGDKPAGLARPALQYTDYSAWQSQMLAGPEGERLWSYWRKNLADRGPPLTLPSDRPADQTPSFEGTSVELQLPEGTAEQVKVLARAQGTTPFVVLLASFHAFLHRLTGADDVIVGTPTFARSKAEFLSIVGDFVNAVPLRARLSGDMECRALVSALRETVHGALDAQEFPLPLLVERLQPERAAGRTPLYDTFFILQKFDQFRDLEELLVGGEGGRVIESGSLRLAAYPMHQQEGQFDLALQMAERAGALHGVLKYSSAMFERSTVVRWAQDYVALVTAFVGDPAAKLGSLPRPASPVQSRAVVDALLARLEKKDIRLLLEGEKLRVNAPKGALDDADKAAIGENKQGLITVLRARAAQPVARIQRLERGGVLPMSSAQQRLWFLDQMDPGRPEYNIGVSLRIGGPLDVAKLQKAIDALVERHESLRCRFVSSETGLGVELLPPAAADFELVELGHVRDPAVVEEDIKRLVQESLRRPFTLAKGPMCRFQLLRINAGDHVFTMIMHHAVSDGWSLTIAVHEILTVYEALVNNRAAELAQLPVQYAEYAGWEREQLHSGRMAKHMSYWKQQLKDAPVVLEMPTDRPRPAAQSFRGARVSHSLDSQLAESLKQLSRREGATMFMTLLAAWQVLLHRCSGQEEIVVGSPVANRNLEEFGGLIGCLVNNVVLRGNLANNPSFAEYLARVKKTTLDAFDHCELPFDVLVEGVNPQRTASHAPLFQTFFTFMAFPTRLTPPAGLTMKMVESDTLAARFDLTLEMSEIEGVLRVSYEYASDLYDADTIDRLHAHFDALLRSIVHEPARPIRDLPILTEDERLLLGKWNDTALEHDRGRSVHHLLEATARARPGTVAAVCGEERLTYGDLDRRANQLSHLLIERGVKPGSLVGVCIDRTVDMPVALAAVLKSGAAYVPLDPTHPADRLSYTLQDAGVACVITLARFAPQLADANAPLLALDDLAAQISAQPHTPPAIECKPEDLAYVIYTSGSTGKPKGVQVEHRNVVAFLEAMRREPGLGPTDVLLAVTTLSFDIAGLEMWLPLTVGARIVIASRADVLDGQRLDDLIRTHGVTMLQATPATWRLLLEADWAGERRLKALCGGEALQRDLAIALFDRVGELWNVYGPTETTIWSTVNRVLDPTAPITVGHPIANTRCYVLEPNGQPAPVGVAGELCIAGEGVARGYRNRPELTAEKFVTISLPNSKTERVYRTGDMARYRGDGQIDFLGRRDFQVKVRGYRIELGEIEAVLATHPGVKECVVVVREDTPGDQRLAGYVVMENGTGLEAEAARTTLRKKLPEYMVPNLFMTLEALPLTPNGKIDRKALPRPASAPAAAGATESVGILMTPQQRRVAAIWHEVLKVDRVGLHDNFFDIGGHSLLLVKLQAALKKEFSNDVPLVDLFQRTTVSAQAERMSSAPAASEALKRARARAVKQVNV